MNIYQKPNIFDPNKLPRNYRDLEQFNLLASASAQFNEDELKNIVLKESNKKITVVDLRLEYHGFWDNKAIAFKNISQINNSNSKFNYDHNQEKNILLDIIENQNNSLSSSFFSPQLTNSNNQQEVLTEQEICLKNNCNYQRFPLQDHHFPNIEQLQQIIEFLKNIESNPNSKIHVHCAAGRGRTAIFLVIYDILKNYHNSTIDEIFIRHARLGGADLSNIQNEYEWSDAQKKHISILYDLYYQLKQN